MQELQDLRQLAYQPKPIADPLRKFCPATKAATVGNKSAKLENAYGACVYSRGKASVLADWTRHRGSNGKLSDDKVEVLYICVRHMVVISGTI